MANDDVIERAMEDGEAFMQCPDPEYQRPVDVISKLLVALRASRARVFDLEATVCAKDLVIAELQGSIDGCAKRVAELRQDARRLDWLADCGCVLMWQDRDQEYLVVDSSTRTVVSRAKTSRAAIDAAMAGEADS